MTLRGFFGLARVELEALTFIDLAALKKETQSMSEFMILLGMDMQQAKIICVVALSGGLFLFVSKVLSFDNQKLIWS